jgi:hypothetical protein
LELPIGTILRISLGHVDTVITSRLSQAAIKARIRLIMLQRRMGAVATRAHKE